MNDDERSIPYIQEEEKQTCSKSAKQINNRRRPAANRLFPECSELSYLASLQLAWSRWLTPLYWVFLAIRAAALVEKSLAVTLCRPGTSRAKRTERKPDAAKPSRTRRPR